MEAQTMAKVIARATVSLDGFIADEADRVGPLFDWYNNGDVPFNGGDPERVFHVSAASAAYMRETWSRIGTAVIGRRLFDITNGWHGRPAAGDAVFVVTHEPPTDWPFPEAPFTFVTDGLASAIAQAKAAAGDKDVSLTGGNLLGQALAAGLVDELQVDLVPVVFGTGIRFFGGYDGTPALLDDPQIVQGDRVTHLRYRVRR
jgi:dihydrofolate reductase